VVSIFKFQIEHQIILSHMKRSISLLSIIIALFSVQWACKNPLNELNDFKLNINGGALINPVATINFVFSDSSKAIPSNVKVTLSGSGSKYIYDELGQHLFEVSPNGYLKLILDPNAAPTQENPIMVRVNVSADDCLPFEEFLYIFDKNEVKITYVLTKESNAPANIKVQKYNANFLGKKASDSLVLEHTNNDGIIFKFTYPKKDVIFINKTDVYFYENVTRIKRIPIRRDTTVLDSVTVVKNATKFHNKQPIDGTVERILAPVKKTLTVSYWDSSYTVPMLMSQTICDTIPIQNVQATVISNTADVVIASGFYDENGVYIDKPRKFTGTVQVPHVQFYTNDKKGRVEPVYSGGKKGPKIEISFTESANYNLYMSGTGFDNVSGSYFTVESARNTKNIDLLNFDVNYVIQTNHQYIWGGFSPNNPTDGIKIAGFNGDDEANISVTLDHILNRCEGNPVLYYKSEKINVCNYINSPYVFSVDYNTNDFLNKYPFAPVIVTTDLICKTGSKVTLPDQVINFRRNSCPDISGKLYLNGGKGTYSLLPNVDYTMYVYSPENGQELSNQLTLNGQPSKTIMGFIEDQNGMILDTAYIGTLTYEAVTKKYNLHVDLFNRVFKYKIPGCN